MIWLLVLVLLIFWLGGFAITGSGLFNLLLLLVVVAVLYELLVRRRRGA